ncbi:hypothetical protein MAR_003372 [Mya arenaria]|uniref:Uncharacterized protein n=1 Tax=Mya arenaria TaxID=6604 RepID=A0ABY7G8C9_MYAAR|nr:hypothetical protein MAR_003372 [Mya arenaria]
MCYSAAALNVVENFLMSLNVCPIVDNVLRHNATDIAKQSLQEISRNVTAKFILGTTMTEICNDQLQLIKVPLENIAWFATSNVKAMMFDWNKKDQLKALPRYDAISKIAEWLIRKFKCIFDYCTNELNSNCI